MISEIYHARVRFRKWEKKSCNTSISCFKSIFPYSLSSLDNDLYRAGAEKNRKLFQMVSFIKHSVWKHKTQRTSIFIHFITKCRTPILIKKPETLTKKYNCTSACNIRRNKTKKKMFYDFSVRNRLISFLFYIPTCKIFSMAASQILFFNLYLPTEITHLFFYLFNLLSYTLFCSVFIYITYRLRS